MCIFLTIILKYIKGVFKKPLIVLIKDSLVKKLLKIIYATQLISQYLELNKIINALKWQHINYIVLFKSVQGG